MKSLIIIIVASTFTYGCTFYSGNNYNFQYDQVAVTKNRNVCGLLKDSVVIYPIFVDVGQFHPWSNFDIESTLDSIETAMHWVQRKADENNQSLCLEVKAHVQRNKISLNEGKIKPRYLSLNLNLLGSYKKKHQGHVDDWADKIAKYAGRAVKKGKESKLGSRNKVVNVERLIARLRDLYETDHIALMFFVNGYYENYPSMTLHTSSNGPKTEYAIITNKNPAIIAHEFLHLFGALDLYPNANNPNFNFKELKEAYPNEIMQIQHKPIESLTLSPITKYYIGWQKDLDKNDNRLMYHKYRVVEY